MYYIVETTIACRVFPTYREAEIFCGENGINPEAIEEEAQK